MCMSALKYVDDDLSVDYLPGWGRFRSGHNWADCREVPCNTAI